MTTDQRKRRLWVAGLITLAAIFGPGLIQLARLSWEQRRLDRQLAQLSADHERLAQEERRLQTDPTYVEGLIRTTFKLAKPGELVIPLDASQSSGNRH